MTTEELYLLTALGMTPLAARRAATTVDAELLGLEGRLGALEPGKLADVIAIPGDPRQNIRQVEHVSFVMKDGVVMRDDRPRR